MAEYLEASNSSRLDPTPEVTLTTFNRRVSSLDEKVTASSNLKLELTDAEEAVDLLGPQADLALLETEKSTRTLRQLEKEATQLGVENRAAKEEIDKLMDQVRSETHIRKYFL